MTGVVSLNLIMEVTIESMEKYKPGYLGKVLPEKEPEMKTFIQDQYEQFSDAYDACKDSSENITDVQNVSTSADEFKMKISSKEKSKTMAEINEKAKSPKIIQSDVTVDSDIISAKKKKSIAEIINGDE